MKILISAAETSSDAHGAALLKALRAQDRAIDAFGVGGPKLKAAGLRIIVDAGGLLAMGFSEILGRLPRIFRALKTISAAAERERPDVAIVIDYPDFHFRLARRLKRLGVPVVYFIPPKVWAWRKYRVKMLRELFVRVLCIFPFERDFYERENVSVKYVGNPLVDELPLDLSREEARKSLSLHENEKVLVVMAGSRPSELKRHIGFMLDAAAKVGVAMGHRLTVLLPFPLTADMDDVRSRVERWQTGSRSGAIDIRISQGNAAECLVAADVGMVKSGTSTLEAALLGCPHVVVYRPNIVSCFIVRTIVRYRGPVSLVNLVAGSGDLVREFVCKDAKSEPLTKETLSLFTDSSKRNQLKAKLDWLREKVMSSVESPSVVAAQEVLEVAKEVVRTQGTRSC